MSSEDLFTSVLPNTVPLAARLRPIKRQDFAGQDRLLQKLHQRKLHSMLLYGPPGCGKTTLAILLAQEAKWSLFQLSAIAAGVKEVREVIEKGRNDLLNKGRGVVLFLDEIHRFSRSQQDSLLQAVESGWIVFIGATTENPSFSVNSALLSRLEVYQLVPLEKKDLLNILKRALHEDPDLQSCSLTPEATEVLVTVAGGDGRRLLSILELAYHDAKTKADKTDQKICIDRDNISLAAEGQVRRYDRVGEQHYDYISAFIKSIRGSDPDAALLYLACMLEGGEDPLFIARRLVILAAEDVGNASPQALNLCTCAYLALERIGLPEGRIILSQAVTFLAACPKSNAAYLAIDQALQYAKGHPLTVPNHLRNAPTKTHRQEGAGQGYSYPHDCEGHFSGQNYFPDSTDGIDSHLHFYTPSSEGKEAEIKKRLKRLWPNREY